MNDASRKVLFRCDAGAHIGGGHLIRCLAFASALRKKGFDCYFLCNEQAWDFPALSESGFARVDEGTLGQHIFAYGIIDHYGLDAEYERSLKPFCGVFMVIDDLADRQHDCDILIDFSPFRRAEDYTGLVPADCALKTGLDYLILREEFFTLKRDQNIDNSPKKIFITMGSIDGTEQLPGVLNALEGYEKPLQIDILMTHKTRTLSRVKAHTETSKHHVNLHVDIKNPIHIMRKADLAISAGGMTCLELVALNVPTLAMIVADNQKQNIGWLREHGYVEFILDAVALDTETLDLFINQPAFTVLQTGETLKIIEEMV